MKTSSLVLTLALGALSARADILVPVLVNTQSLKGTTGFVDFQFDPGPISSQSATVKVEDFSGASYVAGSQIDTGGASGGALPSVVTLTNSTAYNDDYESVIFGGSMGFTLDFGGSAVSAQNGKASSSSSFGFSLSDINGNPVLTKDPNGFDLTVELNTNCAVTLTTPSPDVTITPEPSSILMMGGALLLFVFARYR